MSTKTINVVSPDSITTNGQTIPTIDQTRIVCEDPLALNDGEKAPCEYTSENSGGCSTCGKNSSNTKRGLFGMSKKTWIWIIVGAIVVYYMSKKGVKVPSVPSV
tara:strand:- start:3446 stop:3757 length:312 start_codon:yes stop_codon:yes gene_type:complete